MVIVTEGQAIFREEFLVDESPALRLRESSPLLTPQSLHCDELSVNYGLNKKGLNKY